MPLLRAFLSRRATRSRGHWTHVILMFVLVSSNGRLLSSPPFSTAREDFDRAREDVTRFASERATQLQRFAGRLRPGSTQGQAEWQPAFVGKWKSASSENFDAFLEHALGVGYLKRSIAMRASQQQRLAMRGKVVLLEVSDRRGTSSYEIYPDDKVHLGKGFMKLPIKQRAKWSSDGALLVEERYSQHLGGEEHGRPCSGHDCPVIRSRRSVYV